MLRLLLVGFCYAFGTYRAMFSTAFAACLFLWNDIFQPMSFARSHGLYPVAWYVLVVLVLSFAVNFLQGRIVPRFGVYFFAVGVMILWLLVSTVASPFPAAAWPEFIKYMKYLLPLLLIYCALQNPKEVELVAGALTASVGVWAAQAGAHCLVSGPNIDLAIPGGQMTERNDFTAAIVGTLPMLVYFAVEYRWRFKKAARIGIWLAAALSLAAIFFSLSRGASVGLAAMVMAYVLLVSRRKLRDLGIMAALAAVVLVSLPREWYERMGTIELGAEQKEGSAAERMMLMMGALRATTDNPVFGLGPDGWLQVVHIYGDGEHNPHSIYLKLSSETGFTGLFIYLAVLFMTYWRCMAARKLAARRKDKRAERMATALITAIIGLLAAMTFLNYPFSEYLWAWICLANAFASLYPEEVERLEAGRRGPAARAGRSGEARGMEGAAPGAAAA